MPKMLESLRASSQVYEPIEKHIIFWDKKTLELPSSFPYTCMQL